MERQPRLPPEQEWIQELKELTNTTILIHKEARGGFFYIKFERPETTRKVLALTTCLLSAGTVLFQQWIPAFNPRRSHGVLTPVWFSLIGVPLEFYDSIHSLATCVGPILEVDWGHRLQANPRFCVAVEPDKEWIASLEAHSGNGVLPSRSSSKWRTRTQQLAAPNVAC